MCSGSARSCVARPRSSRRTGMSAWRVFAEPTLDGYQVEWEEEGELLVSRRNQLYRTDSTGGSPTPIGLFPASRWRSEASRLRPAQRLLRFLYYNVQKLPDGRLFASFDERDRKSTRLNSSHIT